jgi:chromo domain-containing protein 1
MFTNLSTQYKHGKRLKREPPPDIHQLDLRRPSEWASMSSINTAPLGGSRILPDTADNSPIGYGTELKLSPKSKSGSMGVLKPERDEASNPPPKNSAAKDAFSTPTSEFNLEVPRRIPGPNAYVAPYHPPRWWYKTDVYVTMYFGPDKVDIGNVRLCDLAVETRKRLLRTKVGKGVEVWFRDLCTLDEYNELCTRVSSRNRCYCF